MTRKISNSGTLASSAYDLIRHDIITAALAPGDRLRIRSICDRFEVGLSPVREALSRLSTEGLVTQVDHRGFAVATLGLADLESLLNARCWLDGIGVRESIARGDAVWEEGVVLAFHRLSRTPRHTGSDNQRNPTWEKLHADFHASLLSACGSSWLFGFCRQLFEAAERYRHVARLAGVQRSPNEDQHRAIMNATVARDPESASALLAAHYRRTAELVRKVLAERESPHK